uniref:DNA topoisomerase (ATP-hydrolyzing) n=1 Tax=Pseudo-nitzschia australis TaxID=44445 RepID=A0A7S4A9E4_9STRA
MTGGRHGYGAKLSNIFSKTFTIDTVDSKRRLRYTQTWNNNMTQAGEPRITKLDNGSKSNGTKVKDYTCITFVPDMQRLSEDPNVTSIDEQDYAVMCRRVVDAAGCAGESCKCI